MTFVYITALVVIVIFWSIHGLFEFNKIMYNHQLKHTYMTKGQFIYNVIKGGPFVWILVAYSILCSIVL